MSSSSHGLKKIAILGAESTGKTSLARSLALRFQTVWVPENAREYFSIQPQEVKVDDIENIVREHLGQETRLQHNANQFMFTDTELIMAKVWCIDSNGSCPKWIEKDITQHKYDLYLLTANDLPWIPDPARINAQRRDYFFNWYKRELDANNLPYEIVTGRYEARLLCAITAMRKHFGEIE